MLYMYLQHTQIVKTFPAAISCFYYNYTYPILSSTVSLNINIINVINYYWEFKCKYDNICISVHKDYTTNIYDNTRVMRWNIVY